MRIVYIAPSETEEWGLASRTEAGETEEKKEYNEALDTAGYPLATTTKWHLRQLEAYAEEGDGDGRERAYMAAEAVLEVVSRAENHWLHWTTGDEATEEKKYGDRNARTPEEHTTALTQWCITRQAKEMDRKEAYGAIQRECRKLLRKERRAAEKATQQNAQALVDETKGLKRETRVLAFATVVLAITAVGQIITTLLA